MVVMIKMGIIGLNWDLFLKIRKHLLKIDGLNVVLVKKIRILSVI